ncbi:85/88 kDa calcium-independent phospholipase A2 isoform X2 [Amia ocellicauda]|uniref:85/88 kDa calcium-independent phospholipase A2 isoform X2 n=1 Tax=Amia ocellicauda TaxID=2972642 RepID=UPI003463DFA3
MEFLGRLVGTLSSVSTLFSNPYRVRDVPLSEYRSGGGRTQLQVEGRVQLYRNPPAHSWDCLLTCPDTPGTALRLFQVTSEEDARNWFPQYGLKLRPFYESARAPLRPETLQPIVDCLRNHPDWSSAHIAVETGVRDCLHNNYVMSQINNHDGVEGRTPLHLACCHGDVGLVRELLEECGARLDITDRQGETPLHCAARLDTAAVTELLCSCSRPSPGLDTVSVAGETALHVACRLGKAETVQVLLGCGARCDVMGGHGYPIHTAMKYSEKSCAEAILGADPTQLQSEDPVYGGTPLHWAKTAEMCRLLLDRGGSVNALSRTADTPLHVLVHRCRFEAAMVLLTHGAPANAQGQHGDTPLHLAMKLDHMELIKALIVFGADVETPNDLGETPGLIAARTSKGPNRKVLLSMLCSIGAEHCHPPSPATPPQILKRPPPPPIGFDDIMHVAATLGALTQGKHQVDGLHAENRKCERLLCLDGGGIKGLVLIQLLIALEHVAGRPIRELFDWVSGTSTGGILALAIVHGKSMAYLRCLYFRMKDEVFRGSRPYESAPLEEFLKREFGEHTRMGDVTHPKVMVTSVLADRHPAELHLFRNYDPPDPGRSPPYARTADFQPLTLPHEQLVWRAARSSGAAPTYFRPMGRFLDGGLLANNPTLDAITEIHRCHRSLREQGQEGHKQKLGVVVSLGTGRPPQVPVTSVDVFRPSNPLELAKSFMGAKELGKMLVDCCTDSDGCAVDRARAWCEMTDTAYYRLSPQFSVEVLLDEVSDAVLVNMLWETQLYLYQQREQLHSLAQLLLQG